jgi:hypothetical protein
MRLWYSRLALLFGSIALGLAGCGSDDTREGSANPEFDATGSTGNDASDLADVTALPACPDDALMSQLAGLELGQASSLAESFGAAGSRYNCVWYLEDVIRVKLGYGEQSPKNIPGQADMFSSGVLVGTVPVPAPDLGQNTYIMVDEGDWCWIESDTAPSARLTVSLTGADGACDVARRLWAEIRGDIGLPGGRVAEQGEGGAASGATVGDCAVPGSTDDFHDGFGGALPLSWQAPLAPSGVNGYEVTGLVTVVAVSDTAQRICVDDLIVVPEPPAGVVVVLMPTPIATSGTDHEVMAPDIGAGSRLQFDSDPAKEWKVDSVAIRIDDLYRARAAP